MRTIQQQRTISIDEFRRKLGELKKEFPYTTFILTDRGKPIAQVSATHEIKRKQMEETFGAWKGTELDDDELWADVLKRHSRKKSIKL